MTHKLWVIINCEACIEIEREFGTDLQEKLNAKIYFKYFVFRDTDLEKIKKLVQRRQIKFIDQVCPWSFYLDGYSIL